MLFIYNVFTGVMAPPALFTLKDIVVSVPMQGGMGRVSMELVSGANASKFLNMGIWYMLMGFVASAGSRVANLGVQLLREIKVVVKQDNTTKPF